MEQAKVRSLPQRLDSFNKILLATATINYMASALDGVLKDYQTILSSIKSGDDDFSHNVIKDGLISKNDMMSETLKRLCDTIEELGNYLDSHDIVCHIDTRVYKEPLNILLHGQDECEKDYEDVE